MIEADVSRKDRTASDRQSATSLQLSSSSPSQQARSLQVMRNGEEVSIKQAHRVPESETYTVQPKTEVHSVSEIDTMEQMTEFYAMSVQHTMQPMTEITTVSVRRNQKVHDIASKHHQTLLSEVEKYQDEAKEPAMHQTGDSEPGGDDQDLLHIPQHEDSVDPNDSVQYLLHIHDLQHGDSTEPGGNKQDLVHIHHNQHDEPSGSNMELLHTDVHKHEDSTEPSGGEQELLTIHTNQQHEGGEPSGSNMVSMFKSSQQTIPPSQLQ